MNQFLSDFWDMDFLDLDSFLVKCCSESEVNILLFVFNNHVYSLVAVFNTLINDSATISFKFEHFLVSHGRSSQLCSLRRMLNRHSR